MAKADQIKALIKSHADGDDGRFYSVAMQVAAQAARSGHPRLAQELKELIDEAKGRASTGLIPRVKPVPLAQPRGELSSILSVEYPTVRLDDMALDRGLRERIHRIILEQRQRAKIRHHGLMPQHKLLLVGPPGTGKTMTAAAVAGELGLPLFTIQLDALITKFMGETASKLRLVFDAIGSSRGVYLFDEFDAFALERGLRNDVGEIRRVLNSFLQFLDKDASDSLIIAATNHAYSLDKALFRRFDAVLTYSMPSRRTLEQVMRRRLAMYESSTVNWREASEVAQGLSHAEVSRACEHAAKNIVLSGAGRLGTDDLVAAVNERRNAHTTREG